MVCVMVAMRLFTVDLDVGAIGGPLDGLKVFTAKR